MWRLSLTTLALIFANSHALDEQLIGEANFVAWAGQHGKEYASPKEHKTRMQIWLENDGACVS